MAKIYEGPIGGLMGKETDYSAVSKLSAEFEISEPLGLEIVALIVAAREEEQKRCADVADRYGQPAIGDAIREHPIDASNTEVDDK